MKLISKLIISTVAVGIGVFLGYEVLKNPKRREQAANTIRGLQSQAYGVMKTVDESIVRIKSELMNDADANQAWVAKQWDQFGI
ncbi:hypothetical protein K6V98_05510 [Collinsella sp. AGMB00827]|uniref:YtxH domain-containing protein n=1 Tax=Collinsella ureilytica TaxID=2869515 RepID=A0ABS7MN12_9ACTN|nr:hypothetical protein [Collinsella urealyticum]MBY4797810.1 hypothetical protein [Collinsella urealyticum]